MKECPFCGKKEGVTVITDLQFVGQIVNYAFDEEASYVMDEIGEDIIDDNVYGYRTKCTECGIIGPWAMRSEDAIKKWDKRAVSMLRTVYKGSGKVVDEIRDEPCTL
jgi:hypothetical protein